MYDNGIKIDSTHRLYALLRGDYMWGTGVTNTIETVLDDLGKDPTDDLQRVDTENWVIGREAGLILTLGE